jgi:hypothetical protein
MRSPRVAATSFALTFVLLGAQLHLAHAMPALTTDGRRVDVPAMDAGVIEALPTMVRAKVANAVPFVIVTDAAFAAAFAPLAAAHGGMGLPAEVHTLQAIQTAYPAAADDAERIRFFLRDAYAQRGTRFVLLGGDVPLIPTRLVVLALGGGGDRLVATDQYFACLEGSWDGDGDGVWGEWRDTNPADLSDEVVLTPHLAVGRAPVRTEAEAIAFVEKTLAALSTQSATRLENLLLVAGTIPSILDLAPSAEALLPVLTADPITHVARLYENWAAWPGSLPESPSAVRDSLGAGYDLAVLYGKGGTGVFVAGGDEPADHLPAADLEALSNARPLHAVFMSAFTNLPGAESIGAALMRNPAGGAVTVLGPTDLELVGMANDFVHEVLQNAYTHDVHSIGEALQSAISVRHGGYVPEMLRFTTLGNLLLGDPALAFPGTAPGGTAVEVAMVSAAVDLNGVHVVWSVSGTANVTVERRSPTSDWAAIATRSPDSHGRIVFEDADISAGHRYGYRLAIGGDAGGEVWVDVPAPGLALRGLTTNPSRAGFRIAFRLMDATPAMLEVYDVGGRVAVRREVGMLGPGDHALELSGGHAWTPGVYWMRLTQRSVTRTARGVVIR